MREKEGRICMIDLNVSPFKCNSPQTDNKRSTTIPPLLSFFSEATKKRGVGGYEAKGEKEKEKRGKKVKLHKSAENRERQRKRVRKTEREREQE